jgi:predicted transcriptional regulator
MSDIVDDLMGGPIRTLTELHSRSDRFRTLRLYEESEGPLDELVRIDRLTPTYERLLNPLSPRQNRVLWDLVSHGHPLRIVDLAHSAELPYSTASRCVYALVERGIVKRHSDGRYAVTDEDPDLTKHLVANSHGFFNAWHSPQSEVLIPDRARPVTYFIEHRDQIRQQRPYGTPH